MAKTLRTPHQGYAYCRDCGGLIPTKFMKKHKVLCLRIRKQHARKQRFARLIRFVFLPLLIVLFVVGWALINH